MLSTSFHVYMKSGLRDRNNLVLLSYLDGRNQLSQ